MGAKSTQPAKRLGPWLARNINTVYQAATDGFVFARSNDINLEMYGLTEGVNPPMSIKNAHIGLGGTGIYAHTTFAVRKYDYWEVDLAGGGVSKVWWIPLEP